MKTVHRCVLVGCIGAALGGPAAATGPRPIAIFDATQIAFDRYVVVKRVGIEDWRSAFRIRGHPDVASATQAVVDEAARAGADGVINLTCFDQTDALWNPAGYFCYANAIRLKAVTSNEVTK